MLNAHSSQLKPQTSKLTAHLVVWTKSCNFVGMRAKEMIQAMTAAWMPRHGSDEARAMVRIVFEEIMHWSTVDMVLREDRELDEWEEKRLSEITQRVADGEPLQYVLGVARFHGLRFAVTPAVLIPRPETEQLVDMIVDENPREDLRVLDLGTGSGCIAISLARALKFPQVTALDISEEALAVASTNAKSLKARVNFVRDDILTLPAIGTARWDIIVSNPPYVCRSEAATMESHVVGHEPSNALFVPDDDPLRYYRPLIKHAAATLHQGGRLYLEVNSRYADEVAALAQDAGLADARVHVDFTGRPRFVTGVRF